MILRKRVRWTVGFALSSLCGLGMAAEPLSSTGLSDSYVSDQPPVIAACQSSTQKPEAGRSGGAGAAPCPVLSTLDVNKTVGDNQAQASDPLSVTPHSLPVMEIQYLEAAWRQYDAYIQQQQASTAGVMPVSTPSASFR
jgi:hypothetical protein